MTVASLLPPNASALERAAEQVTARMGSVPVEIASLWTPDACPLPLLPWLAWALSVDEWSASWTEEQQRGAVRSSYEVHRIKGTLGAVLVALASTGYQTEIVEWFNESPPAAPYTFQALVDISDRGIDDALQDEIVRLIEASKNVRSRMTNIRFRGRVSGAAYAASWILSGETTTVYPFATTEIETASATPRFGAGLMCFDTATVYPPP